ncbi:hypothetical protein BT96DRAFT_782407, partial [Gymnopus androsaceus JB14]
KLLDDAQADMDRCQSELRRLRDLLKEIETRQDVLGAYIACVRSAMSPIHKLPQEMLGEIFKYVCCGDIGVNCIWEDGKQQLPTITLSRVCIRWYNLVNSIPGLWSSFGIRDSDSANFSLFDLFLERSRSHPIDLTISDFRSKLHTDSLSSLKLIENSNRWR